MFSRSPSWEDCSRELVNTSPRSRKAAANSSKP
jgi:hypothetical protein